MKHLIVLGVTLCSLYGMSLDESIKYALKHNNTLKQAELSVERSKKQREMKQSQNFGRVDVSASYDHYNNSRTLAPLTPMAIVGSPDGAYQIPTTKDMFSVGVAYNVVLFNGFAQQNSYKISDLQYRSSAIKSKLGREELIYNVRNLYLSLLALEEQLKAQKLYTDSESRLLERIEKEKKEGVKSKLDVLRAQNALESSKAQESSLEANIAIIKANLSAMFGDKEFDTTQAISINIDAKSEVDSTDIHTLERYRAAAFSVEVSKRKEQQAKAAYYPVIDFGAYYGQNFGPNDTTNIVPLTSTAPRAGQTLINEGDFHSEDIWQLGVHLKWNIFDFGAKLAAYEAAKIEYLESALRRDSVAIDLRKNARIAQNKIKLARAEYSSRKSQYELLSETQKIEQIRYDNNALTLTDLLVTQAKKMLAKAQMINAKYDYQKALYYLEYLYEKGEKK
ncbi:TolC family protein [Sulfurimonas sp. SAG-AH-194-L11]|nr:TolC family protein [Sulfurimonas sp. SAG-AH-194-L11]MDF1876829.1 TolC family protein [Sulfurimonas sp. SAG-AH-194-L11]